MGTSLCQAVTATSGATELSNLQRLRDSYQDQHISKKADPSSTGKDNTESMARRKRQVSIPRDLPFGGDWNSRTHAGDPTLNGALSVRTLVNDIKSGGTPAIIVSSGSSKTGMPSPHPLLNPGKGDPLCLQTPAQRH